MLEPFSLPFVQHGLWEILLLSAGAGILGTWIVLRGLAFYAHGVAAATFPGLVLADGLAFAAPLGHSPRRCCSPPRSAGSPPATTAATATTTGPSPRWSWSAR